MGKSDIPRGEVKAARGRMTEIALELAQRAQPDHLKEIAIEKGEDLKLLAKDKAHEKFDQMKGRAKETVMTRTSDLTDQFATSRSRPYIGAAVGAGLGYLLFQRLFAKRAARVESRSIPYVASGAFVEEEPLGTESYTENFYGVDDPSYGATEGSYGAGASYGDESGGGVRAQAAGKVSHAREMATEKVSHAKERVSSAVHSARVKASGVAHNLGERGHQFREKIPPASLIKQSGQEWYSSHVQEQPLLFALGAVGLGILASALLPVSSRERQLVSPAKQKVMQPAIAKAQAAVETLGSKAEQKLSGMGGQQQQAQSSDGQTSRGIITSENDPMAKDEFGMGIPDPQTFPSH